MFRKLNVEANVWFIFIIFDNLEQDLFANKMSELKTLKILSFKN